jgi:hypothetical protein
MVTEAQKTCRECGALIPLSARVCPNCGVRQLDGPMPPAGGSKLLKGCLIAAAVVFVGVFVMGIFAAIAIPKFAHTKEKAYIAAMKSDLRSIAAAEESYHAQHGRYQERVDSLPGVTLTYGVHLLRLTASEAGWRAVVGHGAIHTICTASGGDMKPDAGTPGEPFCAEPEAKRDSTS